MLDVPFRLGCMLVLGLLVGCGSVQMRAARSAAGFVNEAPQDAMPPGCLALLTTAPNGDRLVRSLVIDKSDKGCLSSSTYPAAQARREGEWLVNFDTATRTTVRYRVVYAAACVILVDVQQNFGGSFTAEELLVLETGRIAVEGVAPKAVLTLLERFEVGQAQQARAFAKAAATARICAP